VVSSQIDLHKEYGGVFPEIASRAHTENIIPVIKETLEGLQINNDIDMIAVTAGPGLIGSLLVGVNTAKTLAYASNEPILPINHWLGHIYSCFSDSKNLPQFPLLALIVSGGHTGLVLMKSHTEIITLGETLDDAVGEAFDKVAKLLGLGYPGGPAISKLAAKGNAKAIAFPRAMLDRPDNNFSFSGLKTAVLNESKKHELTPEIKADFAASFQQACIDILIGKTLKAAEEYQPKSILLCGGVSANKELRTQMKQSIEDFNIRHSDFRFRILFHVPPMELTGDNAAMIGLAATYQTMAGVKPTTFEHISADSNLKF
jgi:N6-L-threonylcarbamoyladenine synthase